ncbi:MAG TPA: DNRLRE domain-containing protein, partial [Anaerolineae bacterium]|nr:DNRLRE domain-containing protein [Anaerolineae bacterium]
LADGSSGIAEAGQRIWVHASPPAYCGRSLWTDSDGRFELRQGHSAISAMELAAYLPGFAPARQRHEGNPSSPSPGVGKGFLLRLAADEEPEPLVLRPVADTWYEYLGAATGAPIRPGGHGDDPVLEASFQDTGVDSEVLLRFDLPPLAMGRPLDRAELWLVVTAASSAGLELPRGADEVALTLGRLGEAWDEAQADGLHRPARVNLPVRTLARAGPVTLDVSETVQAWLDGAAAHGFAMRASSTVGAPILAVARFGSRESAYPPALVIHWVAPSVETATPGIGSSTPSTVPSTSRATSTSTPSPRIAAPRSVILPLLER